jgi:hypothetical protein
VSEACAHATLAKLAVPGQPVGWPSRSRYAARTARASFLTIHWCARAVVRHRQRGEKLPARCISRTCSRFEGAHDLRPSPGEYATSPPLNARRPAASHRCPAISCALMSTLRTHSLVFVRWPRCSTGAGSGAVLEPLLVRTLFRRQLERRDRSYRHHGAASSVRGQHIIGCRGRHHAIRDRSRACTLVLVGPFATCRPHTIREIHGDQRRRAAHAR